MTHNEMDAMFLDVVRATRSLYSDFTHIPPENIAMIFSTVLLMIIDARNQFTDVQRQDFIKNVYEFARQSIEHSMQAAKDNTDN